MPRGRWATTIFAAILAATFLMSVADAATVPSAEDLRGVVPGSKGFRRELRPLDFYIMMDSKGEVVGLAFITSEIPPEVAGYGGELDILVGMDGNGTITSVKILRHNETSEYIQRVIGSGFLDGFIGRSAAKGFADIDAVTGATISTQAIIDDVSSAAAMVYEHYKGKSQSTVLPGGFTHLKPWIGSLAVLLIIAGSIVAVCLPKRRFIRIGVLVLSVTTVGFWLNTPITIGALVDLRNLYLPGLASLPLIILLVYALVAAIVRGNLYCNYICPFGAIQMGLAALKLPKVRPSDGVDRSAKWIRWFVAIITIYAIAAIGSDAFRTIEPFSLCFSRSPGTIVLVQTGVILLLALFVRRIWCRYMCPTGLILDLFSLVGAKVRRGGAKLIRGRCAKQTTP